MIDDKWNGLAIALPRDMRCGNVLDVYTQTRLNMPIFIDDYF